MSGIAEKPAYERRRLLLFLVVFVLIFVRYCYYGFTYFPQLDDYIQYHNNALMPGGPLAALKALGLLASRPLAGTLDLFFWTKFYGAMIFAVALLSAFYAGSACLFKSVFSRHFGTGNLFVALYALLPLGMEGTYWVSAASRILPGLFFASLALYFFDRWCADGKRIFLPLYAVGQLIAYGFYEQILVFSFVSVIVLAFIWRRRERRRVRWVLLSILNVAVYFIFVSFFAAGSVYSSRMDLLPPWGSSYFSTTLPNVSGQVRDAFLKGGLDTLTKGFVRGVKLLFTDVNVIYVLVILFFCALFWLLTKKEKKEPSRSGAALIAAIVFALAPISIFFVIGNTWLSLRNTVPSFCGIALLLDTIFALLFGRARRAPAATAVVAGVLALVFCVSSVSEIHDYRQTTLDDTKIITLIADTLKSDGNYRSGLKVGILNVEPTYLDDQNYDYHEHINGVTSSDWALTGAVSSVAGIDDRPAITPLPASPMYQPWNADTARMGNYDAVYLYESGALIRVYPRDEGGEEYALYDAAGHFLGHTWEENEYGYLVLGS